MAETIYSIRNKCEYKTAVIGHYASEMTDELRVLFRIARAPQAFYEKYKDGDIWRKFCPEDKSLEEASKFAAELAVERIVNDSFLERIEKSIRANLEQGKSYNEIRLVVPFPLEEKYTHNNFAPAMAAFLAIKLEGRFGDIPVVADMASEKAEDMILNIVCNNRGATSNAEEGQDPVLLYMQRIFRQPVYSGLVNSNMLYVPIDDFLVGQSTTAGLVNYIVANGADCSPPVVAFALFKGLEIIAPQQATLDYLNLAITSLGEGTLSANGGPAGFKSSLQGLLHQVGLKIDFDNLSNNTLSNVEMLYLAGFFADGSNQSHTKAYFNALAAIGATEADAKGSSPDAVARSEPRSLIELKQVLEASVSGRELMGSESGLRFQTLISSGNYIREGRG